ncbi:class I SAM-dependent DNA methyltransferase [Crocosphaera subtropica]|nr:class I SAM-dependent methyltransferase [Crocosphaera subtropica]
MLTEDRYTEYDTWAWLYNETMGPEYGKNQEKPIETLLLSRLGEEATLLDLCCGTGHLTQQLLEKGYQVTGFDGSEGMLAYARQNAPNGRFLVGDARGFNLPNEFDGVVSSSASLNHILSLEDLKKVFENVYIALRNNGLFLFDMNHPEQMKKWWKGKIVEGEIADEYAWMLVPNYNAEDKTGNFAITLFQAPNSQYFSLWSVLKYPFKQLLYKLLNLRLLTRFRLKLLANFSTWEKEWQRSQMVYQVRGYDVEEIKMLLESVGFVDVEIRIIDGSCNLDSNHSAYFICRKPST